MGVVSRFTTFHLQDWNCLRVFLALLIWRKLGFLYENLFLKWPPTSIICSNSCLFRYPMITSGSGIGASFGFHQSPLPLVASSHSGIGASCGFHQSPLPSVASSHYGIGAFLWISSEPSSVYLRGTPRCCKFCLNFVSTSVLVANCTFLLKLLMLNISFGCC